MKNNDLLSIKEVAEAVGISQQAVYKQLNNKLKPYLTMLNNKKMLKKSVLSEVFNVEVEKQFQQKVEEVDNNFNQQFNQKIIEILQKELEQKNLQIAELQKLLDQEQQLRMAEKRQLEISEHEDKTEPKKKPWWKKLFESEE